MTDEPTGEQAIPSTTWRWKYVKVGRSAGGHGDSAPKALRWHHLPRREARDPLTLSVSYRGGPECWWEVRARGSVGRWPGSTCLHDVLDEIMRGNGLSPK